MTSLPSGGGALYDGIMTRARAWTPEQVARFRTTMKDLDPEDRFTQLARELVSHSDTVVDLGTGTGAWFSREVAPLAGAAIGIDESALSLARSPRGVAYFIQGDASRLPLADGSVSVVLSRRGPLSAGDEFLSEAVRVLAPGGVCLEITIGEQNGREVTEVFGASQMAEDAALGPRLPRLISQIRAYGLEPVVTEDYRQLEYFPSSESLLYRLLTTPILPSFDPEAQSALFAELVRRNTRPEGIGLTYHRLVWAARKAA